MSTENQLVALDDISIDKAPAIYGHNKLNAYVALAREADIAHKTAVLTSIKEAFMGAGITEEQAKTIINMIRKGEVPSVSITY